VKVSIGVSQPRCGGVRASRTARPCQVSYQFDLLALRRVHELVGGPGSIRTQGRSQQGHVIFLEEGGDDLSIWTSSARDRT
jgi:hypothetical protein